MNQINKDPLSIYSLKFNLIFKYIHIYIIKSFFSKANKKSTNLLILNMKENINNSENEICKLNKI